MEIKPLTAEHLPEYADVIRKSFATVAQDFGYTSENCPGHTSFITNERLKNKIKEGYYPFGCIIADKIIGFASLTDIGNGTYEMNDVAILPEYRHFKYGKTLLDFCKSKVAEFGGQKISIGIIETNTRVKNWYTANGFIHTGTKKYESVQFEVGHMEWRRNTE
ncbi:MAG: GNAT family N-acetyltransferase [Oscillospiraceae bacterium]|nr:GNAT family N-acetyltransferase [Oscillospiraceae bacterium]